MQNRLIDSILDEFYRRAKATAEERKQAEE